MIEKKSFLKTLSKNSATLSGMGMREERRSSHTIIDRVVRINTGMSQRGNLLKPGLKEGGELEGMFELELELELEVIFGLELKFELEAEVKLEVIFELELMFELEFGFELEFELELKPTLPSAFDSKSKLRSSSLFSWRFLIFLTAYQIAPKQAIE